MSHKGKNPALTVRRPKSVVDQAAKARYLEWASFPPELRVMG